MNRLFGCDPAKRAWVLSERGFDLLAMAEVFADKRRRDYPDVRFDYGEARRVTIGIAHGRIFTVVYTMRGSVTWLITAWPASRKERQHYEHR
jgi:uncharacterized DUF497 family protein